MVYMLDSKVKGKSWWENLNRNELSTPPCRYIKSLDYNSNNYVSYLIFTLTNNEAVFLLS